MMNNNNKQDDQNQNPASSHFLIVAFPAHGHVNPALNLATRLLQGGAHVTFATSTAISVYNHLPQHRNFSFTPIPDSYSVNNTTPTLDKLFSNFRHHGIQTLTTIFTTHHKTTTTQPLQRPQPMITCLIHTLLLPWAAQLARDFHVPTALLWVQPATTFDIVYYYYNGYKDIILDSHRNYYYYYSSSSTTTTTTTSIKLPNLQYEFKPCDIPTFLLPSSPDDTNDDVYLFWVSEFEQQMQDLTTKHVDADDNPLGPTTILVNTFEALEPQALKAIQTLNLIPIGPLLGLEGDESFQGPRPSSGDRNRHDHQQEEDYIIQWLDSKQNSSVIYVCFGSIAVLSRVQMEELGKALLHTNKPFLWVIREKEKKSKTETKEEEEEEEEEEDEGELSCMKELREEGKGLIVKWCNQVEVLSHSSVGCFVSHCGWNSTLESLTKGVPIVGFPQRLDQTTNAKLVEQVWKVGMRVVLDNTNTNNNGVVKWEEIRRCLEMVMMENNTKEEIKQNCIMWKDLSFKAAKQGGSSHSNIQALIQNHLL